MAESSPRIDLSGQSFCLVSGASKGIGRATAVEVSKNLGPKSVLLLWARNKQELAITASLCNSHGVKVLFHSIDLSIASEKEMYDNIVQALAGYKVTDFANCLLYHNVTSVSNQTESVEAPRTENYDLNVSKVMSVNTQFFKVFQEIQSRFIIVNFTSRTVKNPMAENACDNSGMAAREMFFKTLGDEKKDIKLLNYCPEPVDNNMIGYALSDTDKLNGRLTSFETEGSELTPEVTAEKVMKMLLSGKFRPEEPISYIDGL